LTEAEMFTLTEAEMFTLTEAEMFTLTEVEMFTLTEAEMLTLTKAEIRSLSLKRFSIRTFIVEIYKDIYRLYNEDIIFIKKNYRRDNINRFQKSGSTLDLFSVETGQNDCNDTHISI
jgi:hypothetical protein